MDQNSFIELPDPDYFSSPIMHHTEDADRESGEPQFSDAPTIEYKANSTSIKQLLEQSAKDPFIPTAESTVTYITEALKTMGAKRDRPSIIITRNYHPTNN